MNAIPSNLKRAPELPWKCIRCGGILEIPDKRAGDIVQCYHCGLETWLQLAVPDFGQKPDKAGGSFGSRRLSISFGSPPPSSVSIKLPPKVLRYALIGLAGAVVAAHLIFFGLAVSAKRNNSSQTGLNPVSKLSPD